MNILSVSELDTRFYNLLSHQNVNLFLELGAFDAETSLKVKTINPSCEVYAFEANPYNYDMFKEGIQSSGIRYHNLAISDYTGTSNFYVQISNRGRILPKTKKNNSLMERNEKGVHYEQVEVRVDTIDNLLTPRDTQNIAMWIDVEGVGYEALVGAEKTLEKTALIKIEVESKQFWKSQVTDKKIISFLESKGFIIDSMDQERKGQYNIIFKR